MRPIKQYATVAAFILSESLSHGTSVAILRTPKRVVVAADSHFGVSGPTVGCKIKSGRNISYAMAGLIQDSRSKFYPDALAMDVAKHSPTVADAVDRFEKLAVPQFAKAVSRIKGDAPHIYNAEIKRVPEPFQIVFFAVESNVPLFIVSYFTVVESSKGVTVTPHRKECPGSACESSGRTIIMLGENSAATKLSSNPTFWVGINDPISAVRKLVQTEIDAVPSRVQPPISILSIDTGGLRWIEKGKCE